MAFFSQALQAALAGLDASIKENMFAGLFKLIQGLNTRGLISWQRMHFGGRFYKGDKEDRHFCNFLKAPLESNV